MPRLEEWYVRANGGPYCPPEGRSDSLGGIVYDHPLKPDGHRVITSRIVKIDEEKREIKTYSGSVYTLGEPASDWLKWLEDKGYYHGEDVFPFFFKGNKS